MEVGKFTQIGVSEFAELGLVLWSGQVYLHGYLTHIVHDPFMIFFGEEIIFAAFTIHLEEVYVREILLLYQCCELDGF